VSEDERRAGPDKGRPLRVDRKTLRVIEQVLDMMGTMEEPLRERWAAAINAEQYGFRMIEPDRDLDPTDKSIPEEEFAAKMQMYLTDDGEFSSITVPTARRRTPWPFRRRR
jgi:hypothetical protein